MGKFVFPKTSRNKQIHAMRASGATLARIAKRFKISVGRVAQILKREAA